MSRSTAPTWRCRSCPGYPTWLSRTGISLVRRVPAYRAGPLPHGGPTEHTPSQRSDIMNNAVVLRGVSKVYGRRAAAVTALDALALGVALLAAMALTLVSTLLGPRSGPRWYVTPD